MCGLIMSGGLLYGLGIMMILVLGVVLILLIGLVNIGGMFYVGWFGKCYSKKYLLVGIYLGWIFVVVWFILMLIILVIVIIFLVVMGLLWLVIVLLILGFVVYLYGLCYMGMFYGIVFFSY